MRSFVVGGAGFIGSHMVDLLIDRGFKVRVIDNLVGGREANIAHHAKNPDFTFAPSDIRDYNPGNPLFEGVDYVFHFAGIGDIEAQTRQVCENLKAAAEAAGGSLADICRVDVYVRNIENFEIIHKVRREYFKAPLPASTMVEVAKLVSSDYLIEISAIAVIPDA